MDYEYADIAGMIDHALLNPATTDQDLQAGIRLAVAYQVASVCIVPFYLQRCAKMLEGSGVKASTVIGFPHGVNSTAVKRAEAKQAVEDGCQELDMVVNIAKVISNDWQYVRNDLRAVIETAHNAGQKVKVIFENCYLSNKHKIQLCEICSELGADWVKTSTGFGSGGATAADLQLMRGHSADHVQVKASGGIRSLDTLLEFRQLGVSRCGASGTAAILDECRQRLGLPPVETP